jgi:hypothetical protein
MNKAYGDIVEVVDNINAQPKVTRMTQEEADELYYKENDCISDDVDAEQSRIDQWIEDNDIEII